MPCRRLEKVAKQVSAALNRRLAVAWAQRRSIICISCQSPVSDLIHEPRSHRTLSSRISGQQINNPSSMTGFKQLSLGGQATHFVKTVAPQHGVLRAVRDGLLTSIAASQLRWISQMVKGRPLEGLTPSPEQAAKRARKDTFGVTRISPNASIV